MAEIITTHELCKQYRPPTGPVAIRSLNLQIQEGEIFSLLGPNGAGKTTLIALLCGLFPPTSGDAIVAGHSIVRNPMAVKSLVGVVPEEVALYAQRSARQNLRYFGSLYGLGGRALDEAIDSVLQVIGLADRAGDRVAHYSSGMRRRLNIGLGILHRPRIVLMDEPTLGLAPESRRRILDLVRHLRRDYGTTILYATHHMEEAEEISDRVGIIHRGEIIALGSPRELVESIHSEDIVQLHAAAVSSAALDALRKVAGVGKVALDGNIVTLAAPRAADALPEILRVVQEAGIVVRTLSVQQPSLESVFLRLTGQRLTETP